jgi:hypothetical protein
MQTQVASSKTCGSLVIVAYTFKLFQNPVLREKRQGLSIQPRQSSHNAQAFATREVEGDYLITSDAVEVSIGSKAQAARFAELSLSTRRENPD